MSVVTAIARLSAMNGEDLRFRVACEARNAVGRWRFAVRPPRHDRRALARILDPAAGPQIATAIAAARRGDPRAAHQALSRHFRARTSRWPLQAARRTALTDEIRRAFPDAAAEARRRADRILEGKLDLLGYRDLAVGNPPDWHADVVHGTRAPLAHWTRVPYLDPSLGDHKVIWEANRHQYWLTLGTAYWLTGDRRYRDTAIAHLQDWIAANPPLAGVNWASMLELAFRTISWTWAVEFFADAEANDEAPWLVDLLLSLDRQLTHVRQNLSTYFSPNTHISGEGLALYVVSQAFPELRRSTARAAHGRAILAEEAVRQIHADGGHAELSSHYHRYSTDFYLLALIVGRAAGDPMAAAFEDAARRQAIYLRTIADDRGILPQLGDDDGGQLFRFGNRSPSDASASLGVAASVLDDASLAVSAPAEEVYWILGRRPETSGLRGAPTPWPSRALPQSGYFVSRTPDGSHLVFDAGRHGFLNGGHAHADALSIVLRVGGEPVFVDPGTGSYTVDPVTRDRFRLSRMHNTLVLDGQDHGRPRGAFRWHSWTDARLLVSQTRPGLDFAAGTHDGYAPRRHVRAVLAIHEIGWLIVDRVTGSGVLSADTWWHLHPTWEPVLQDGAVRLRRGTSGTRLAFASTAPVLTLINDPDAVGFAPEYGRIERGIAIKASCRKPERCVIASFVPATAALADRVAIVEVHAARESAEWDWTSFHIRAGHAEIQVDVPFPAGPAEPPPSSWPRPCIEQLMKSCVE